MALIKVYEIREQRDAERKPESRGYLVAVCRSLAEAMAKAETMDAAGRNVAVYTAYTTAEAVERVSVVL